MTQAGLTGEVGTQKRLLYDVRQREQFIDAVRQLEVTLGKKPPVFAVREMEPWSRIPERRIASVQFGP
ncbi:MAG: hypothetical protein Q8O40_10120 [Chloroflexota bacterium]|nr:hypothetical protein [Chloroflexota bacterium]